MRKSVDLLESLEGDLILDGGDLKDTSQNVSDTYFQVIRLLLNSKPGENLIYPDLGINFDQFYGKQNTSKLGYGMARIIKQVISENTKLYATEINIEPFPLSKSALAFKIDILTLPGNGYGIVFDTQENTLRSVNYED